MGQRFQIITNISGWIKVYHCQWLWGDYAIRRLGTAVKNFLIYNKDDYGKFEDYLKSSFYGKANDMNSFCRYNSEVNNWDDNKWIVGKKKYVFLNKFLRSLDNNAGFFYIEFADTSINHNGKGIKGYCFMRGSRKGIFNPINAEEYIKDYTREEGFTKKQQKEFEDGLKTFSQLKVIEPIKIIKKGE